MAPKRPSRASAMSNQSKQAKSTSPTKQGGITPKSRSTRPRLQLNQTQKQALIDNLQLEITERARKLRAQYALQAQSLRTRLEIRVHRIPVSLRQTTVTELLEQHLKRSNPAKSATVKSVITSPSPRNTRLAQDPISKPSVSESHSKKRKSSELDDDKENGTISQHEVVKKRALLAQSGPTSQTTAIARNTSRKAPPSQILSPKSNNARTFPNSPYKPTMSPTKPIATRPTSPLKAAAPLQRATSQANPAEKRATAKKAPLARGPSKKAVNTRVQGVNRATAKRGAAEHQVHSNSDEATQDQERRQSNVSEAASTSTSTTTIVRASKRPATAAIKGKVAGIASKFEGISANGKKIVPSKAAARPVKATAPATNRTLRKRA